MSREASLKTNYTLFLGSLCKNSHSVEGMSTSRLTFGISSPAKASVYIWNFSTILSSTTDSTPAKHSVALSAMETQNSHLHMLFGLLRTLHFSLWPAPAHPFMAMEDRGVSRYFYTLCMRVSSCWTHHLSVCSFSVHHSQPSHSISLAPHTHLNQPMNHVAL